MQQLVNKLCCLSKFYNRGQQSCAGHGPKTNLQHYDYRSFSRYQNLFCIDRTSQLVLQRGAKMNQKTCVQHHDLQRHNSSWRFFIFLLHTSFSDVNGATSYNFRAKTSIAFLNVKGTTSPKF